MIIENEVEQKSGISKKKYNQLRKKYFFKQKPIIQNNFYFDTITLDFISKKQTIRVRQIKDNYTLTIKLPKDDILVEKSIKISKNTFNQFLNEGIDLNLFGINKIVHLRSQNTTYRLSTKYLDGEIFLDKTYFKNSINYEVEYESSDVKKCEVGFNNFLEENNIILSILPPKSFRAIL